LHLGGAYLEREEVGTESGRGNKKEKLRLGDSSDERNVQNKMTLPAQNKTREEI